MKRPHTPLRLLILATLGPLLVAGCAGTGASKSDTPDPPTLYDVSWHLDHLESPDGPVTPVSGHTPTLEIRRDNTVQGLAGCNTYQSTCTVNGQSVRFGPLSATKKRCPNPESLMAVEQRYLAALGQITTYAIDGDQLTLQGNGGLTLVFRANGG